MHIHLISIFPEIFTSFLATSLVHKAQRSGTVRLSLYNPREFTHDKHQQVDDEVYGWWAGLLLKAQPIIDVLKSLQEFTSSVKTKIVCLWPSQTVFDQSLAHDYVGTYENIVLICGRYEWFDHRLIVRCQKKFWERFWVLSLGKFITLGWEVPAMIVCEALIRLLPWVINDPQSRKDESYRPEYHMWNLEYPQYTRPYEVEGITVPEVLLSGHHKNIQQRRVDNSSTVE